MHPHSSPVSRPRAYWYLLQYGSRSTSHACLTSFHWQDTEGQKLNLLATVTLCCLRALERLCRPALPPCPVPPCDCPFSRRTVPPTDNGPPPRFTRARSWGLNPRGFGFNIRGQQQQ